MNDEKRTVEGEMQRIGDGRKFYDSPTLGIGWVESICLHATMGICPGAKDKETFEGRCSTEIGAYRGCLEAGKS